MEYCEIVYLVMHNWMFLAAKGDVCGPMVWNYFGRKNVGLKVSPSDEESPSIFVMTCTKSTIRH
jgi:hypothetical protein